MAPSSNVVKAHGGRCRVVNRTPGGKTTPCWDKTSPRRVAANQTQLLMGVLAYNLLHILR